MPETLKLNQAGRLFDLALLIAQHPRQYTAPMLAERFKCSLRTVRRDIRTLEDMGILVFSEDVSGYVAEDIQSHTVIREARRADGRYEVAVRVRFNPEFVRFVLQYGSQVEVQSPERIRAQLREETARMMRQYINAP